VRKLLSHLPYFGTAVLFFTIALGFFYVTNGANFKTVLQQKDAIVATYQQVTTPPSQYEAWLGWWDESSAQKSLTGNQKLRAISPVWLKIDTTGKIIPTKTTQKEAIKKLASENNIKLIPTVTNDFDPKGVTLALQDRQLMQNAVDDLVYAAFSEGYGGLDINWEEITPHDQDAFALFVKKLSSRLHDQGKILQVTVHAQTGEELQRAVVKGYNTKVLSEDADFIKIMAYDFHYQNSAPGAITPMEDLEKVLTYNATILPKDKVIIGLPTYGYDWVVKDHKAEAVSFSQAKDIIAKFKALEKRDPSSSSLVAYYQKDSIDHAMWFEDKTTIEEMVKAARAHGFYQFSFWRLGVEDPELWNINL
jgi:spore germination protein